MPLFGSFFRYTNEAGRRRDKINHDRDNFYSDLYPRFQLIVRIMSVPVLSFHTLSTLGKE